MSEIVNWIQVGELAEGFAPGNHSLDNVADLAGETLTLYGSDGSQGIFTLQDTQVLTWRLKRADQSEEQGESPYRLTTLRTGIYFLDLLQPSKNASLSLVVDIERQRFTLIYGVIPTKQEVSRSLYSRAIANESLTAVNTEFIFGTLNTPCAAATPDLHAPTRELLGMCNHYTYSPTERYEHIYLNENFYTWHCLSGVEKGLCDTDRCHYIKITQGLYLFVWREKIIPTLGVVLIDLQKEKTDGKIVGFHGDEFNELSNFSVGAYLEVVQRMPEA